MDLAERCACRHHRLFVHDVLRQARLAGQVDLDRGRIAGQLPRRVNHAPDHVRDRNIPKGQAKAEIRGLFGLADRHQHVEAGLPHGQRDRQGNIAAGIVHRHPGRLARIKHAGVIQPHGQGPRLRACIALEGLPLASDRKFGGAVFVAVAPRYGKARLQGIGHVGCVDIGRNRHGAIEA